MGLEIQRLRDSTFHIISATGREERIVGRGNSDTMCIECIPEYISEIAADSRFQKYQITRAEDVVRTTMSSFLDRLYKDDNEKRNEAGEFWNSVFDDESSELCRWMRRTITGF